MPFTTVVAGTTITAAWGNANIRDQVVTPFAAAAARSSAVTSPVEGMVSYLADTDTLWMYNGTAWVNVTGVWTSYSPAWIGGGSAPSIGNGTLVGRWKYNAWNSITANVQLTAGSTTTWGNNIWYLGLPVAKAAGANSLGVAWLYDSSTGAQNTAIVRGGNAATNVEVDQYAQGPLAPTTPWTWAQNDAIWLEITYEPA